MSIFKKDKEYQDYLEDGSIFGKMDKQEWDGLYDRADEIDSGLASGLFERDERVWEIIKKKREHKR
jgi:hypothetical protein